VYYANVCFCDSTGIANEIFTKPFNKTSCTEGDIVKEPSNSTLPEDALAVSDVPPTSRPTQQADAALDQFFNSTLPDEKNPLTVSTDVQPIASNDTSSLTTTNATQEEDTALLEASNSTVPEDVEDLLTVSEAQPADDSSSNMSNHTANTTADILPNEFSPPSTLLNSSSTRNTNSTTMCAFFRNLRGCGS
jgi:hypothetical protein